MSSTTTKGPTILLVTTSFATASFYEPTLKLLPNSIDIQIPHLPSVGPSPPAKTPVPAPGLHDDASFILSHLRSLIADQSKSVILIAHSYGGIPATEALGLAYDAELFASQRSARGEQGGLVRVGYMSAMIPEVGKDGMSVLASCAPYLRKEDLLDFGVDETGQWLYHTNPQQSAAVCAPHTPASVRDPFFTSLSKHSAPALATPIQHAGYLHVPVSWLLAEGDRCIPPEVQRETVSRIEGSKTGGEKVDVTSKDIDHVVNLSRPEVLAEWLVGLVEKS